MFTFDGSGIAGMIVVHISLFYFVYFHYVKFGTISEKSLGAEGRAMLRPTVNQERLMNKKPHRRPTVKYLESESAGQAVSHSFELLCQYLPYLFSSVLFVTGFELLPGSFIGSGNDRGWPSL